MANEIDLGKLQDSYDSAVRKAKSAETRLKNAKNAFIRAEEASAAADWDVAAIKEHIRDAARNLTK